MGQARPSPDERASRGRRREGEGEGEGGEQEDRSDEERKVAPASDPLLTHVASPLQPEGSSWAWGTSYSTASSWGGLLTTAKGTG